jgi:hypothetical protein
MASRPHTTYKKRQKELQRLEKQRDKVARRLLRKAGKDPSQEAPESTEEPLDGPVVPQDGPALPPDPVAR